MPAPEFVVIGNPASRRVELFQAALRARGQAPARLISYLDLLAGRASLPDLMSPGDVLRVESPGKDADVERALLVAGADVADDSPYDRLGPNEAAAMIIEKGRIVYPRQWYLGFCAVLREIERQRALCPPHTLMNHPDDIAVMFDKRVCHGRMRAAGVAVPRGLGGVASYEELVAAMRRGGGAHVLEHVVQGQAALAGAAYPANLGAHVRRDQSAGRERAGLKGQEHRRRLPRRAEPVDEGSHFDRGLNAHWRPFQLVCSTSVYQIAVTKSVT